MYIPRLITNDIAVVTCPVFIKASFGALLTAANKSAIVEPKVMIATHNLRLDETRFISAKESIAIIAATYRRAKYPKLGSI